MNDSITSNKSTKYTIDDVAPTSEALSGRGGLSLFVRYLTGIALFPHLERLFGTLRKSSKGQPISEIFKQIFCFFVDGTSRHLVYFDQLSEDTGYAQTIETPTDAMLSSHAVKRFFGSFWWPRIYLFRRLLQKLFIWRLKLEKPEAVVLGIDVMVMDNDEAPKRHGVRPTYKKEKGFAPLQMTWGRFIIDAVFRSGDKHSNHSDTVQKMVEHVVRQIRKHYRADVPIVIRCDSGFFDQKVFDSFEALGIGYICAGKTFFGPESLCGERCLRMDGRHTRRSAPSGNMSSSETEEASGKDFAGRSTAAKQVKIGSSSVTLLALIPSSTQTLAGEKK